MATKNTAAVADMAAFEYAPEIEARRADYNRLADSLAFVLELEHTRVGFGADLLDSDDDLLDSDDDAKQLLIPSVYAHLQDLLNSLQFDTETLRRFYAELRLTAEQQALNRKLCSDEARR